MCGQECNELPQTRAHKRSSCIVVNGHAHYLVHVVLRILAYYITLHWQSSLSFCSTHRLLITWLTGEAALQCLSGAFALRSYIKTGVVFLRLLSNYVLVVFLPLCCKSTHGTVSIYKVLIVFWKHKSINLEKLPHYFNWCPIDLYIINNAFISHTTRLIDL